MWLAERPSLSFKESVNKMKQTIKKVPVLGPIARHVYRKWIRPATPFQDSESYWKNRYETGGNSGDGSYNELAEFKAEVLNAFIRENSISSVIEFGCGDGNQLALAQYPKYIGFDVSPKAISMCRDRFASDATKDFRLMKDYVDETAELTLSLDVLYHLVEDTVFVDYMNKLFDSSGKFVIIYSSDSDDCRDPEAHVRHRCFSAWVAKNKTHWKLVKHIPNRYPFRGDTKTGSFSDFYVYSKV